MSEELNTDLIEESDINCTVADHFDAVKRTSLKNLRTLGKFRHSLLNCQFCTEFGYCELLEGFNLQIDSLIAEITEEWGW